MTELILVRHGQTDSNVKKYLQGQSDGLLTEVGKQQAKDIARILKNKKISRVLSSPLIRAKETAEEIAKMHGLAVVENQLLKEWNCGILDGLPAEVLFKARDEAGVPIDEFRPEGGETLIEVQQRADKFLADVQQTYLNKSVVVCSHGDFLRMLMSLLLGIGIIEANTIHLDNATFSSFVFVNNAWRCEGINKIK